MTQSASKQERNNFGPNYKDITQSRASVRASKKQPAGETGINADIDTREERLFRSIDYDNDETVLPRDFENVLRDVGIQRNDYRLRESMSALEAFLEARKLPEEEDHTRRIPRDAFCDAVRHNILLIERALQGRMVIPDFKGFSAQLEEIFDLVRQNRKGAPADYIPQLQLVEPEVDRFAVSTCTVDGQQHSMGDAKSFFSVQSVSKPINYCLALEEHGRETVHKFVGQEPSGSSFNELTLSKLNQPHNPMINAGAIMSSSLIHLSEKPGLAETTKSHAGDPRGWAGERFEKVMSSWRALCGHLAPRFSTSIFLSERETADRNYALAYFMREKQAFPDGVDMHDVLEFYIQCCAIEMNTDMLSVIAATLANGGICPTTGERVFEADTVRCCLSLMSSCGMYDFSGEFAFSIGLPAKSGVSGAIMVVVPNIMGFCIWSPRIDEMGNSVRGIEFCRHFVDRFNFHNFDSLAGMANKKDPRLDPIHQKARLVNEMILAASKGDLGAIQEQMRRGSQLSCADYDRRTPLHLAAAENQLDVARYFIDDKEREASAPDINPRDRWGGTPLDDAYLHGHQEMITMLEAAGATRGQTAAPAGFDAGVRASPVIGDPLKTGELIWAASQGDLAAIGRLVAQGVSLEAADYDHRTAMHLAAAEGHVAVVQYFLAHGATLNPRDRWGNTPFDEAVRHGHGEMKALLAQCGGVAGRQMANGRGACKRKRAA